MKETAEKTKKGILISQMSDSMVEPEQRGFINPLDSPKGGKHVPDCLLYIIVAFTLFNIVVAAALFTAFSVRVSGKCSVDPEDPPEAPCDDDWIWYRKKCYYFSKKFNEWQDSQDICASHNASLARIDSLEELAFLQRFKGSSDHWIGLKREDNGDLWIWTNGSLFNDTFHIDGVSQCVFLNRGRISSAACYSDRYWICNKPDRQNER